MNTFEIGDTLIDLPEFLETRIDDDTLVAHPPETDYANLRFTLLSVRKEDGSLSHGAGERSIRKSAEESNSEIVEYEGKIWFNMMKPSSEGSHGSMMHYWHVGMDAYSLIVSCFVDSSEVDNPTTKKVLNAAILAIKSFRKSE